MMRTTIKCSSLLFPWSQCVQNLQEEAAVEIINAGIGCEDGEDEDALRKNSLSFKQQIFKKLSKLEICCCTCNPLKMTYEKMQIFFTLKATSPLNPDNGIDARPKIHEKPSIAKILMQTKRSLKPFCCVLPIAVKLKVCLNN